MAGVHQTLREVRSLYEAMTGSAERAKRAVERVEGFEKQVERLVHTADENARIREARLKAAYERLESLVDRGANRGEGAGTTRSEPGLGEEPVNGGRSSNTEGSTEPL